MPLALFRTLDLLWLELHTRITHLNTPLIVGLVTSTRSPLCSKREVLIWIISDSLFFRFVPKETSIIADRSAQGEVESISQMKPKAQTEHDEGLLEYLEDIIGTSGYKKPIEDAFAELDRLGEERSEKLNRLRIVEREKQALEVWPYIDFRKHSDRCKGGQERGGRLSSQFQ
jgi:hypothetical protein